MTKIGNQCDPTKNAICSVANSACVDSGMNTNTKMCMCNANFVSVSANGTDTCGKYTYSYIIILNGHFLMIYIECKASTAAPITKKIQ